ncbi:MAG: hypothetical protein IBJ10_03555 [Phycisphaerales bacterium]|nr:hypothetical protein [Phycisphaerales bacterium]
MKTLHRLGAVSTSLLLSIAAGGGLLAGGAMLVTGTTPCELMAACDTGAKAVKVSDTKVNTGACPISSATVANAEKAACTDKSATPAATTVANKTEKAAGNCCAEKAAATKVATTAEKKAKCTDAVKAVPASTTAAKADDCCATKAATLVNASAAQCTDAVKTAATAQCADAVKAVPASTTAAAPGCCSAKAATVASTAQSCETKSTGKRVIMAAGRYPVAVPANFTFGKAAKVSCTDGAKAAPAGYVCSGDPGCETDDSKVCSKGDDCHKATTAQAEKAAVPAGAGS